MFDLGFSELLLIAVVALVVLGPERLPRAAKFAGLWVRRARAQWYSVKAELERELADDELRRSLEQTAAAVREAGSDIERGASTLQRPDPAPPPAEDPTPSTPPLRDPDPGTPVPDEPGSPEPVREPDPPPARRGAP